MQEHNVQYVGSEGRLGLYDVIYPAEDAQLPLVIFCHGFKGFKDWGHWQMICENIAKEGFVVIKFNFTHNGIGLENPQDFTDLAAFSENNYMKELKDLDRLLDHIQKDSFLNRVSNTKKVHLIGHSRGGSISILKASTDKRIKSVCSWAAVADLEERLSAKAEIEEWKEKGVRYIPNSRTRQEMPVKYQFVESLIKNSKELSVERASKRMSIPMLIVHGENDPTVGLEHAYALQVWNTKANLVAIPNADHVFNGKHPFKEKELPFESKQLVEATVQFLKENGR